MDAIDVSPTRLERAKLKVKALLAHRQGGRTALYAYAGSTHLVLPLTDDAELLQTFVDALQTRIMPRPGRDTVLALQTIDTALAKESVPGTVLFLTDGIEPAATAAFKAQVDGGGSQPLVLAIGTEEGGPLRSGASRFPGRPRPACVRPDGRGRPAGLQGGDRRAARHVHARWRRRRGLGAAPGAVHLAQKDAETATRWKDQGWWFTIPIALLRGAAVPPGLDGAVASACCWPCCCRRRADPAWAQSANSGLALHLCHTDAGASAGEVHRHIGQQ